MSGGPNLISRELLVRRSVRSRTVTYINWDRGFFRLWCLTSGAWAASWALYATISNLDDGLWTGAAIKDSRGALRAASRPTDNRVYDQMGLKRVRAETSHERARAVKLKGRPAQGCRRPLYAIAVRP